MRYDVIASTGLPSRFWSKVYIREPGECWIWTASTKASDYGQFMMDGKNWLSHRLAYEDQVGPIPGGLTLDHLCRVRKCCNPSHLEAVTIQENIRRGRAWNRNNTRKAACRLGHPYVESNISIGTDGVWECLACRSREPSARGTHCPSGHLLTADNLRIYDVHSAEAPPCAQCHRERNVKYQRRKRWAARLTRRYGAPVEVVAQRSSIR